MNNNEHQAKTKPCKHCSQPFKFKRKTAEFCSEYHKKAYSKARTAKLHKQRKYNFASSAFTFFLADSCRRSGTIEALPKTLDELEQLHKVYKFSLKANGYGEDDQYSLCHIFPIQHPHFVGTLSADNLCVSSRSLNSKYSNSFVQGAGRKISRMGLKPKWLVSPDAKKKDVVAMIVEYLGADYTATIAVKLKLQPATRQAVLDWLTQSDDSRVPPLSKLEEFTTAALTKLKAEVSGKSAGYLPSISINVSDVFLHEVKRLSQFRPELERVADAWENALDSVLSLLLELEWSRPKVGGSKQEYDKAYSEIGALIEAQFQLLHGGRVEDFFTVLATFTEDNPPIDSSESHAQPIAPKIYPPKKWTPSCRGVTLLGAEFPLIAIPIPL